MSSFFRYWVWVPPQQRRISTIVSKLLEWYPKIARDLPWRRTNDPYGVFISEIMLQQTQVKTVIPYWERWMKRLPTMASLAKARPQTVLKLWEGLGYYTRARNLQKAARMILDKQDGEFPHDFETILSLPGVGRYTAGAICSIAFNQPTPVLDGNVIRVLTRLLAIPEDPRRRETNEHLWDIAQQLVTQASRLKPMRPLPSSLHPHTGSCSCLNQSLMELGALICLPRLPQCHACPLKRHCQACQLGQPEAYPQASKASIITQRRRVALVLEKRDRYLVRQRPDGAVNARLWEFPNVEIPITMTTLTARISQSGARTSKSASGHLIVPAVNDIQPSNSASGIGRANQFRPSVKLAKILLNEFGLALDSLETLAVIKHSITRYRFTIEVVRGRVSGDEVGLRMEGAWHRLPELRRLPFTGAHRRIVQLLGGGH